MTTPSWTAAFLKARRGSSAMLECLTFFHPTIQTFRMVKNDRDIISRGETFNRSWFDVAVINNNDQQPRAALTVPIINSPLAREVMKLNGSPLKCTIEVLSSAHLDEPFYIAAELLLTKIKIIPNQSMTGDLTRHDYGAEAFGKILVTQARFPAIHLLQTRS